MNRVVNSKWSRNYGSGTTAFYNVDITYDRNSNILRTVDHVHAGFDVSYGIDDLNRLIDAEEGTWSGSAITSKTRHQNWTLDHAGNWDNVKHDFDGAGWDVDEDRDHNEANELLERDSGTPVTLVYDAVGNLTDDGSQYKYVYDAFGRLRKMLNQSDELVAEYVYNGLGHRIGVHYDVNEDGDVDGDDVWYWFAYDERWRVVATFRANDPPDEPKEIFVYHAAGLGGFGGSSYIDSVILRDRDANTDWDAASDGVLEERIYYCQNWRHDVVALITDTGEQVQQIRYSAYGIPIGLPAGDVNSNGSVASADDTIIAGWISTSHYDVRGDLNLDGVVDNADRTLLQANIGVTLGWGAMSLAVDHAGATGGGGNRKGYAGYEADFSRDGFWHVRHRVLDSELGRWTRRDPLGYVDGMGLYEYVKSASIRYIDPLGLLVWVPGAPPPPGLNPNELHGFDKLPPWCWEYPFPPGTPLLYVPRPQLTWTCQPLVREPVWIEPFLNPGKKPPASPPTPPSPKPTPDQQNPDWPAGPLNPCQNFRLRGGLQNCIDCCMWHFSPPGPIHYIPDPFTKWLIEKCMINCHLWGIPAF